MFRPLSIAIVIAVLMSLASCKSKGQVAVSKPLVASFAPPVVLEEVVVAKPDTNQLTPQERKVIFLQKTGEHPYW